MSDAGNQAPPPSGSSPSGAGTVSVQLGQMTAQHLARLCVELGTDDAGAVVGRALGLLDLCLHNKRRGGRVCVINPEGETSDVAF